MAGPARRLIGPAAAVLLAGVAAAPASPVTVLAGRYSWHFRNGDVTGRSYWSDDVAEIVPVDADHAYFRFALAFFNGHLCSLAGIAATDGDALVYHGPPDDTVGSAGPCRLVVRRAGATLAYDDGGTCKAHCGARGSLSGSLSWASKRPIAYLARLKGSSAYRDALSDWRNGTAAR